MKARLILLLLAVLFAPSARAFDGTNGATLFLSLRTSLGRTNDVPVTLEPHTSPLAIGSSLYNWPHSVWTTNGSLYLSNVPPGNLWLAIPGAARRLLLSVPDTTNTYNAVDITQTNLAYFQQPIDIAAGSGVTITTQGWLRTIGSTGGGGSGTVSNTEGVATNLANYVSLLIYYPNGIISNRLAAADTDAARGTALTNALVGLNSQATIVLGPGGFNLDANVSITNAMDFTKGGYLVRASGTVANLTGGIEARDDQWIFRGAGTTSFSNNYVVGGVSWNWFGAKADYGENDLSGTANETAIQAAWNAASRSQEEVTAGDITYAAQNHFFSNTPVKRRVYNGQPGGFFLVTSNIVLGGAWGADFDGQGATLVAYSDALLTNALLTIRDDYSCEFHHFDIKTHQLKQTHAGILIERTGAGGTLSSQNYTHDIRIFGNRGGHYFGVKFTGSANNEFHLFERVRVFDHFMTAFMIQGGQAFNTTFRDCAFNGDPQTGGWFGVANWDPKYAPNSGGSFTWEGGGGGGNRGADFLGYGLTWNTVEGFHGESSRTWVVSGVFFPALTNQFAYDTNGTSFWGTNNAVAAFVLNNTNLQYAAYTNDYTSYSNQWVYEYIQVGTYALVREAVAAGVFHGDCSGGGTLFNIVKVGPAGITNAVNAKGSGNGAANNNGGWTLKNNRWTTDYPSWDGRLINIQDRGPVNLIGNVMKIRHSADPSIRLRVSVPGTALPVVIAMGNTFTDGTTTNTALSTNFLDRVWVDAGDGTKTTNGVPVYVPGDNYVQIFAKGNFAAHELSGTIQPLEQHEDTVGDTIHRGDVTIAGVLQAPSLRDGANYILKWDAGGDPAPALSVRNAGDDAKTNFSAYGFVADLFSYSPLFGDGASYSMAWDGTESVRFRDAANTNWVFLTAKLDATNLVRGVVGPDRLASGSALQVVRRNAGNTALEFATISAAGAQTPWASAIDGAGYSLTNAGAIAATQFLSSAEGSAAAPAFGYTDGSGLYFGTSNTFLSVGGLLGLSGTNSAGNPKFGIGIMASSTYALRISGGPLYVDGTIYGAGSTPIFDLIDTTSNHDDWRLRAEADDVSLSNTVTAGIFLYGKTANTSWGLNTNDPSATLHVAGGPATNILALSATAGGVNVFSVNTNGGQVYNPAGISSDQVNHVTMPKRAPSIGMVLTATNTTGATDWAAPSASADALTNNNVGPVTLLSNLTVKGAVASDFLVRLTNTLNSDSASTLAAYTAYDQNNNKAVSFGIAGNQEVFSVRGRNSGTVWINTVSDINMTVPYGILWGESVNNSWRMDANNVQKLQFTDWFMLVGNGTTNLVADATQGIQTKGLLSAQGGFAIPGYGVTIGDVWTATNATTGAGHWVVPSSGIITNSPSAAGELPVSTSTSSAAWSPNPSVGAITVTNIALVSGGAITNFPFNYVVAASDTTTAITTGTGKVTFRMPFAATLTGVRASVSTAPTGSTIICDLNENGTSVLSTKLSIDASEKTSTTAASAVVISDASLADDSEMSVDFDQVGSSTAGVGVVITLYGTRTYIVP